METLIKMRNVFIINKKFQSHGDKENGMVIGVINPHNGLHS